MKSVITVDCGTTNTRVAFVEDGKAKDTIKLPVGAGTTAVTGSTHALIDAIKAGVESLKVKNGFEFSELGGIFASGMITSELGLCDIPHICNPAGCEELKNAAKTVLFEEIAPIPITFIPGVRNNFSKYSISDIDFADMMRGEETELFGLMELTDIKPPFTAILPGTHNKIIKVDDIGRIEKCYTAVSGELLAAISQNTILKNSLPSPLISDEPNLDYVDMGFKLAKEIGVNAALFKVRILSNFYNCTDDEKGSFFVGAVLCSDIELIAKTAEEDSILIGGSKPLRSVFEHLAENNLKNPIVHVTDKQVALSTVSGALRIMNVK